MQQPVLQRPPVSLDTNNAAEVAFHSLTNLADDQINLLEAALVIAQQEKPDLDIDYYLQKVDGFADAISEQLPAQPDVEDVLHALNDFLFTQQGYVGNVDNYYDASNSLIDEVIDKKLGIPITMSILYMAIGRKLGLDLQGIAFPGHFLVSLTVGAGVIILDPFFNGISLSEEELRLRLDELQDVETDDSDEFYDYLEPASNKLIIERLLRNLRAIYIEQDQLQQAIDTTNKIITLDPDDAEEYLLRGSLYRRAECVRFALHDYQHYMSFNAGSDVDDEVRAEIIKLQKNIPVLH